MIWHDMIYMIRHMIWYIIWHDVWWRDITWYDIYLLTAIKLTPGGSSTVHIYTQTVHRTTQLIWEDCGPCPVLASYILAFALKLRKKHGKTSVRVAEECQLARWEQNITRRKQYVNIQASKQCVTVYALSIQKVKSEFLVSCPGPGVA